MSDATVIVHFDEQGEIMYHVYGDVRVYIVDESAPDDRVYEWLPRATGDQIAALIPVGAEIGNSKDERYPVLAHKIRAYREGKSHLSIVDPQP